MITLKDLSERCGVSIATISNVINGKSNVSEKTRKIVQEAIKETGYQPNYFAYSLRSNKTKTLGLIVEDITAFSSPELIDGIMSSAEEQGYRCVLENLRLYNKQIFDINDDYKASVQKAFAQLLAIKVDGILYVASHGRTLDIVSQDVGIPVVFVYAKSANPKYPSVLMNDEKAAEEMVTNILEKGWKNIATITGTTDSEHTSGRIKGYKAALEKAGKNVNEAFVLNGNWQRDSGYNLASKLMELGADAVFCQNDIMAAGVMDYLREQGKVPGKDFGVAGFDCQDFINFMSPNLATMKIPLRKMGSHASKLLIDIINGKDPETSEYFEECSFVTGATV